MNIKRLLPTLTGMALLGLAAPHTSAWNGTGHMVVASIAYDHLTPQAKAGVDALLARHRDYGLWMREMPVGYTDKGRWAFLKASTWPDDVRKTPDDHPSWHYINLPIIAPGYTPDPAAVAVPTPNAETQIAAETALLTTRAASGQDRAVALCWIEHLIGDIHQPLHDSTLFSAQFPHGDRGGNDETLAPNSVAGDARETAANPQNLHALWDDLLGTTQGPAEIQRIAAPLESQSYPRGTYIRVLVSRDLQPWIAESHALVQPYVYLNETLPMTPTGPEKTQVTLPPGYLDTAHRIANQQISLAGYRLAGVLNAEKL